MSNTNDSSLGGQIRSGLKGIHGVGEAIRGTAMDQLDRAVDPKSSSATGANKNQAIADKGLADIEAADKNLGHKHGTTAGAGATTTPGTTTSNLTGTAPPTGTTSTATGNAGAANTAPATSAGAHSTAPGNIGSTGATVGQGAGGVQEQPGISQRF